MKKSILSAIVLVATVLTESGSIARAQGIHPQCPPGTVNSSNDPDNTKIAQDACQKAIDLFKYAAPQLGAVLAGGTPTQGISGTLGGPGHFSLGVRANALRGSLPQVDRVVPNTRGAQVSTYGINDQPIGFVTADLGIGLFKGMQMSGFGALDVLVSASYLPSYNDENVDIAEPSGSFKLGFGAKLGILRESAVRPGISVSYLDRGLPYVTVTGKSGSDRLVLGNLSVRSRSWRAIAGKSFLFLGVGVGVGAGAGQDYNDSNADITVTIAPRQATAGGTAGPIALGQKLTRTNFFGTAWLNAKVFRLVGEIGRVTGGTDDTYNQFDGPGAADARNYASVGLSFGR